MRDVIAERAAQGLSPTCTDPDVIRRVGALLSAASRSTLDSDPRRLLRIPEAADFLGVSTSNLYKLLAVGTVKAVRIGAARRVPLLALHEYVDRLLVEADGAENVTPVEYNHTAQEGT